MKRNIGFALFPFVVMVFFVVIFSRTSKHYQNQISRFVDANPQHGVASWYGNECLGHTTAYGYKFDPEDYTCAAFIYKKDDVLVVTNVNNGKYVIVQVTDKGPYDKNHKPFDPKFRIIDLSRSAFSQIEDTNKGLVEVNIRKIN